MSQKHQKQSDSTCFIHDKSCHLLYDSKLLAQPEAELLNTAIFQVAQHVHRVTSGGRGQAWFMELEGVAAVYRKYWRGGLVAKVNQQTYFSFTLHNTRSINEWRLLQKMHQQGLPVPRPIAASVCRWPFVISPFYRAQILVQRIADAQTLDQLLGKQALDSKVWGAVGQCIRLFHHAGVYHDDLNANNILLDGAGNVYLIDFDKGEFREAQQKNAMWMQANLQRLKRSLLKQQAKSSSYYFSEDNWQQLLAAYNS